MTDTLVDCHFIVLNRRTWVGVWAGRYRGRLGSVGRRRTWSCWQELGRRTELRSEAVHQRYYTQASSPLPRHEHFCTNINIRLLKLHQHLLALAWSVALYGSETWTLRKKTFNAFEMLLWRKIEFSRIAHVSNEEVLSLVQERRSLVHVIKQGQTNWIGHVLRHDCRHRLLKTVLEGKTAGKQTQRKQRRKMIDTK